MKVRFTDLSLNKTNRAFLFKVNEILDDLTSQGYTLTLRQLYYQLVMQAIIPNSNKEYKKLGVLLGKGRMAGIVDWSCIEDRLRVPQYVYYNESITEALQDAYNQFKLERQNGQDIYKEIWIEKDALSGIFKPLVDKWHVRLMVNRGYSSISAMYDAYGRVHHHLHSGEEVMILYFGDHDPSGLDMVRDIRKRITDMLENGPVPVDSTKFSVNPIALNMKQIMQYKPPPNPAKITDPRASEYLKKYGDTSWELDALSPNVLVKLADDAINLLTDLNQFNAACTYEKAEKKKLKGIIQSLD